MTALATFLRDAKAAFLADVAAGNSLEHWVIALGNEAGDLDTLASSVAFAFLSRATPPTRFIPLLFTPPEDLYLRPENTHVLASLPLDPAVLLSLRDLPSPPRLPGAAFALVDHNRLLPPFAPDGDARVTAILDHHADEGHHAQADPRVIQPVGSCSSLVAAHFLTPPTSATVPDEIRRLLLAAILIDTSLKPVSAGGKATPADFAAVELLSPSASPSSAFLSTTTSATTTLEDQASELNKIKASVSHLSGRDLLRRDYKAFHLPPFTYGIATVPLSLTTAWLSRSSSSSSSSSSDDPWSALTSDLTAWVTEHDLSFVLVATTFSFKPLSPAPGSAKKKTHARELVLLLNPAPSAAATRARLGPLSTRLEQDDTLRLVPWAPQDVGSSVVPPPSLEDAANWKVWRQANDRASRKQIAPVVRALLEGPAGSQEDAGGKL